MLTRRHMLAASVAGAALSRASAASGKMALSIHQNTSAGSTFQKSLEGWSKAGIRNVEPTWQLLEPYLKTNTVADARRLLSDLGLKLASCGPGLNNLWDPNPNRAEALETMKRRCEVFASLGAERGVFPSAASQKLTADEYKIGLDRMRETGEIARQFQLTAMVEFTRASTFIGSLTTSLKMTREAAHPNVRPMLDCYHFWSGLSKFEDLDLIHPGEIAHVHFQDTPDMPRELLDQTSRVIPGDGVAPLGRILKKLADKGYAGALSVELFLPRFQQADPYELAREIREKGERVMRQAGIA